MQKAFMNYHLLLPFALCPLTFERSELSPRLPCLDSSPDCISQLTQAAIANSAELVTLDESQGAYPF